MKKTATYLSIVLILINISCRNKITMSETTAVYQTHSMGFSQAVTAGGLLFTSGQVGWDTNYQLTGKHLFEDQLKQSFLNVENILHANQCSFKDVLLMRYYVKQLDAEKKDLIGRYLNQYFLSEYKPATSLLGVQSLAREDLLIEIEIIANLPK